MKKLPLAVEKLLNAPIDLVWKVLTDKEAMQQWYFDLTEFQPVVGFVFQFMGGPSPEKQYLHVCEITEVVPKQKLTYSWRYEGYEGISYVTFELLAQGNKTELLLTHSGLETFPASNPDLQASNFVVGWNYLINTSLENYLAKALSS